MPSMFPSLLPEPVSIEQYQLLELITFLGDDACLDNLAGEVGLSTPNHPSAARLLCCVKRMGDAGLLAFRKRTPVPTARNPIYTTIVFELGTKGQAMLAAMRAYRDAHVAHQTSTHQPE